MDRHPRQRRARDSGRRSGLALAGLAFFAPPPPNAEASPIPFRTVMAGWRQSARRWRVGNFHGHRNSPAAPLGARLDRDLRRAAGLHEWRRNARNLLIPFPAGPDGSPAVNTQFRWLIAAFYAPPTAIGAWWLVLFNRRITKEYFAGTEPVSESARPLSISVIAWYLLIGTGFLALSAIFRMPVVLFGFILTVGLRWPCTRLYAAVQIYLGTGLLHLQREARIGAIGYFCFTAVSAAVSFAGLGYAEIVRQNADRHAETLSGRRSGGPAGPDGLYGGDHGGVLRPSHFLLVRRRSAFH